MCFVLFVFLKSENYKIIFCREAQNKLDYDKEELNQYFYSYENLEYLNDVSFISEKLMEAPKNLTISKYVYKRNK